jgi:hypothetical protein
MNDFKNNVKKTRSASATAYARREQPAMRAQCAFLFLRRYSQTAAAIRTGEGESVHFVRHGQFNSML